MERFTRKQQKFVDRYAEGVSGAQAARLAGYGKGERVTACRLLKKPKIRQAIEHQQQVMRFKAGMTKGQLILAALEALEKAKYDGSINARLRCLDLLARVSGLYPDR